MDKILVFAAGGGGDVATASAFALKLRKYGIDSYIAAAPWERLALDPVPGPIKFDEIINSSYAGDYFIAVDDSSYAIRNGKKIIFQAVNASKACSMQIYLCDMNTGVEGLTKCFREISDYLGINMIIGLDVGGDILADGYEESLWSPLADQLSLSSLYKVMNIGGVPTEVAVASPGADGELDRKYVFNKIDKIALEGGLLETVGFGELDIKILEKIFSLTITEAGKAILDALKGFRGWKKIRNGTRSIYIDLLSTLVFIMDTSILFERSKMAEKIYDSKNIDEADDILLRMGVATEYELEKEACQLISLGKSIDKDLIFMARENVLKRVKRFRNRRGGGTDLLEI